MQHNLFRPGTFFRKLPGPFRADRGHIAVPVLPMHRIAIPGGFLKRFLSGILQGRGKRGYSVKGRRLYRISALSDPAFGAGGSCLNAGFRTFRNSTGTGSRGWICRRIGFLGEKRVDFPDVLLWRNMMNFLECLNKVGNILKSTGIADVVDTSSVAQESACVFDSHAV